MEAKERKAILDFLEWYESSVDYLPSSPLELLESYESNS